MQKYRHYITVLFVVILAAMAVSVLRELSTSAQTKEPKIRQQGHKIKELLDSRVPAKTLCEGNQCADDFRRYRQAITEQIGSPYVIRYGNPPINEGAVYIYWKYGSHRIDLSYRAVSAHYRNQGRLPFVEYIKRAWTEPPAW